MLISVMRYFTIKQLQLLSYYKRIPNVRGHAIYPYSWSVLSEV